MTCVFSLNHQNSLSFLKTLLNDIKERFNLSTDIEITVEANPDAIHEEKMDEDEFRRFCDLDDIIYGGQ